MDPFPSSPLVLIAADKSGLVTLFSNLLNSANIRMLYSSTFHTANILVDAGDVRRAKKLLGGR